MSGLEYDSSSEDVPGWEGGETAREGGGIGEPSLVEDEDAPGSTGDREERDGEEREREESPDSSGGEEEEREGETSEDEPEADRPLDTTTESEPHSTKNVKTRAFLDSSDNESDVDEGKRRRGGENKAEEVEEEQQEQEEEEEEGEERLAEQEESSAKENDKEGERKAEELFRRRRKFLDDSDDEEGGNETREPGSSDNSQLDKSRIESTTQEDLFGASEDEEEEERGSARRREASFERDSETETRGGGGGGGGAQESSEDEEDSVRDREEQEEEEEEEEVGVLKLGEERVVGKGRGEEEEEEEDEDPRPSNAGVSDWDMMMQRRKEAMARARKRRKRDIDITAVDDHIMAMIREMRQAVEEDRQLNQARQPALKKLKMLPTVLTNLKKSDLQTSFIECGILTVLSEWLSPLPDRSLPHLKIRESILDVLKTYPVPESHILKSSRIGKAVMLLYRHPKETRRNKEKAGKIINEWARPIFGLASDFKSLGRDEREERDYANLSQAKKRRLSSSSDPSKKNSQEDEYEPSKPGDKGWIGRARVPMPSTRDYVVRPKWKVEHEYKRGPSKKVMNRYEKQINKEKQRKMRGKNTHAVSISVEGRKMPL